LATNIGTRNFDCRFWLQVLWFEYRSVDWSFWFVCELLWFECGSVDWTLEIETRSFETRVWNEVMGTCDLNWNYGHLWFECESVDWTLEIETRSFDTKVWNEVLWFECRSVDWTLEIETRSFETRVWTRHSIHQKDWSRFIPEFWNEVWTPKGLTTFGTWNLRIDHVWAEALSKAFYTPKGLSKTFNAFLTILKDTLVDGNSAFDNLRFVFIAEGKVSWNLWWMEAVEVEIGWL